MDYDNISDLFRVLGNPVRLKIVEGLIRNECNVKNIVSEFNIPQSTVSQHLAILRARGIVKVEKQGVKSCYKVVDKKVKMILKALGG